MKTSRLSTALLLSVTSGWAHPTLVYTNHNGNVNIVSAFAVGVNGALTPVPGSPFQAGGTGGIDGRTVYSDYQHFCETFPLRDKY